MFKPDVMSQNNVTYVMIKEGEMNKFPQIFIIVGLLFGFYGISTVLGYLTWNLFLYKWSKSQVEGDQKAPFFDSYYTKV